MKFKFWVLIALVTVSLFACKGKKKLLEEPKVDVVVVDSTALYQKHMAIITDSLNAIVNGTSALSLEEQQNYLNNLKKQNIKDVNVLNLIIKANDVVNNSIEAKNKAIKPMKSQLEDNFAKIINAANYAEADAVIKETLDKFENADAPVLIILYKQGTDVDYDKPTTIKEYLNYLKLQKKSNADIDQIYMNTNGKIKSLDLMHKK
jgi:hypothetical protein